MFYTGLESEARVTIDQAAGGSIMGINPVEGEIIIYKIALNFHLWPRKRNYRKRNTRQEHIRVVEMKAAATKLTRKFVELVTTWGMIGILTQT